MNPFRKAKTNAIPGKLLIQKETGKYGTAPGEFKSPQSIVLDHSNSTIYVADLINCRVQVFSLELNFLFLFPLGAEALNFKYPYGLCISDMLVYITASSTDYLTNPTGQGLYIFTTDGVFVCGYNNDNVREENSRFSSPQGIAVDAANSSIYIADYGKDRVIVLHNDLRQFNVVMRIKNPRDVKIYRDKLYILSENCIVHELLLFNATLIRRIVSNTPEDKCSSEFFDISDNAFYITNRRFNNICCMAYDRRLVKLYTETRMFSHIKGIALLSENRLVNVCEKDIGRLKLLNLT